MKVICTICARGGSQGVKNKNILRLRGKPLIAHTILQAKKSQLFDTIVVSSDSKKILSTAKNWDPDYVIERPAELALATAGKLPTIQHAVAHIEALLSCAYDVVVDLDVTSPLRLVSDICRAFQLFSSHPSAANLVSATPARRSPYFNMLETGVNDFVKLIKPSNAPVLRRQDAPRCFDMNASIYIWNREDLFKEPSVITDRTILYVMPEERSIDIDSKLDLELVKLLAKKRQDMVDYEHVS